MIKTITKWVKKEILLVISWVLAIVSTCIVPLDKFYIEYIDWKTLGLLFSLMAVMAGLKEMGVFQAFGESLLLKVKSKRAVESVLVLLCFFSSMIITNDVALITFVPFALEVLTMANLKKHIIPVVVMQTVAANLGSMLTPIGNPQNLYLYSKSGMSLEDFLITVLPYVILSFFLLVIFFMYRKNEPVGHILKNSENNNIKKNKVICYSMLFLLCLLCVAKIVPVYIVVIITILFLFIMDRKILKKIDYSLLLTFVGFFIFVGNMGRISILKQMIEQLLKGNEIITIIGASQVISNVPAALLLSGFTNKWDILLIGTNLGGLGTMIASMASLISYKYIIKEVPEEKGNYFIYFTVANIVFLFINLLLYWILHIN